MSGLVLVVDDRREVRELLAEELEEVGLRVVQAADGVQGWACYRRAEPDLVVTDLRMPRSDGIDLLRRIREVASTPVIVLTAHGDTATSVAALSSGAEEFLTFPDDLGRVVDRGRQLAQRPVAGLAPADLLAGSSSRIRRVRDQILRLAAVDEPVLVRARSARARASVVSELHARSLRSAEPLLGMPAAESDGTLPVAAAFVHLEDVERLSAVAQAALAARLRDLDPLAPGVGLRVISSTEHDLDALAAAGEFEGALARMLGGHRIEVPPLRERLDDLRELVPALVRRLARLGGLHDLRVPAPVVTALRAHPWPGDLDQLVRVLEGVVRRARGGVLALEDVEQALCDPEAGAASLRAAREVRQRDELARLYDECQGNLAEMARRLGVSRGSVVYRLKTLGLPARSGPV